MSLIDDFAAAIQQMEGWFPGSVAYRNNNPGNLRAGKGQIGTSNGYAVFPDYQTGLDALKNQIQLNISKGLTTQEFFAGKSGVYPGYAPAADSNQPNVYANFVAGKLGIDPNVPLTQVVGNMPIVHKGLGSMITDLITSIANSKNVPASMALAVAQHESGFDPNAKNPTSSASGLFQLVNAAQKTYGVTNPFDPVQNTTAGVSFLSDMLKRYNGDQNLALMAYAWGPGNVDTWIKTGIVPADQLNNYQMSQSFASYVMQQMGVTPTGSTIDSSGADTSTNSSFMDLSNNPLFSVAGDVITVDPPVGWILGGVILVGLLYVIVGR